MESNKASRCPMSSPTPADAVVPACTTSGLSSDSSSMIASNSARYTSRSAGHSCAHKDRMALSVSGASPHGGKPRSRMPRADKATARTSWGSVVAMRRTFCSNTSATSRRTWDQASGAAALSETGAWSPASVSSRTSRNRRPMAYPKSPPMASTSVRSIHLSKHVRVTGTACPESSSPSRVVPTCTSSAAHATAASSRHSTSA